MWTWRNSNQIEKTGRDASYQESGGEKKKERREEEITKDPWVRKWRVGALLPCQEDMKQNLIN